MHVIEAGGAAWVGSMIVGGVLVSTVDNFIKPWPIGFGIQMPLSLTILGGRAPSAFSACSSAPP
jgi:hypothetical protein